MTDHKTLSQKIAQAIIFTINFLEEKEIPAWTTTIQKVLFLWLLSKKHQQTRSLYKAYLYGPYSNTVSNITTRLCTLKYLNTHQSIIKNYHVNKEKINPKLLKRIKVNVNNLSFVLEKLKETNLLNNTNLISGVAKIAWIETFEEKVKGYKDTIYNLLTKKYSWNLSKNEFETAYKKWEEIKPVIIKS